MSSERIEVEISKLESGGKVMDASLLPKSVTIYDPGLARTAWCESAITQHGLGHLWFRGQRAADFVELGSIPALLRVLSGIETRDDDSFVDRLDGLASMLDEMGIRDVVRAQGTELRATDILARTLLGLAQTVETAVSETDEALALPVAVRLILAEVTRERRGQNGKTEWVSARQSWAAPFVSGDSEARLLDQLLLWQADHQITCSTAALRVVASSGQRAFKSAIAGLIAWEGPKHAGATENVADILCELAEGTDPSDLMNVFLDGGRRVPGFGHRLFRSEMTDERSLWLSQIRDECENAANSPMLRAAKRFEGLVSEESYFRSRNLFPNPDWYNAQLMLFSGVDRRDLTGVQFAGRSLGFASHWIEQRLDPATRMVRPRQIDSIGIGN